MASRLIVLAVGIAFLAGCAAQLQYGGIDTAGQEAQTVHVVASAPAKLYVDSILVGQTPLDVTLRYPVVRVLLSRRVYNDRQSTASAAISQEDTVLAVPRAHLITVTRDGYEPAYRLVSVPGAPDTIAFPLRPVGEKPPVEKIVEVRVPVPADPERAPYMKDIACSLRVEARQKYFSTIESVLGDPRYIAGNLVRTWGNAPKLLSRQEGLEPDQLIYEQRYYLISRNSDLFDQMIQDLLKRTQSEGYVFNIENPYFYADFRSTGAQLLITHTVTGKVRAGSRTYRVELADGGLELRPVLVDPNGEFQFPVRLSPNTRYVYLVSNFRDVVTVFKRLDVFHQADEELGPEQFLLDLGITQSAWERIWSRRL